VKQDGHSPRRLPHALDHVRLSGYSALWPGAKHPCHQAVGSAGVLANLGQKGLISGCFGSLLIEGKEDEEKARIRIFI
jgi:hypothetical protein